MKVYVEGGGDAAALKSACREGFSRFLEKAGLKGRRPRIVACGSRANAYDSFRTSVRNGEDALLLVDSEAPVEPDAQEGDADMWRPWLHLQKRQGDGWSRPDGSEDLQCHLMVQTMEAWLLADRDTLKKFFGQGFRENALPSLGNDLEQAEKRIINDGLRDATRQCRTKGAYSKGEHSFKLLALIDPEKVQEASPWAKRFVKTLQVSISAYP